MIEIILLLIIGGTIGAYVMYSNNRLKELEQFMYSQPSTEELAKEIIKIKVPLSELPPEMAEKLKQRNQLEQDFSMPPPIPPQPLGMADKKIDYVG